MQKLTKTPPVGVICGALANGPPLDQAKGSAPWIAKLIHPDPLDGGVVDQGCRPVFGTRKTA